MESGSVPEPGSNPTCPASTSQSPARTAGEYGPATGGAFGVGTGSAGIPRCLAELGHTVPLPDHARLAFVAEDAERGGAEREEPSAFGRQAQPGCAEDAEEVAMREERGVASGGRRPLDDSPGARPDVLEGFAVG